MPISDAEKARRRVQTEGLVLLGRILRALERRTADRLAAEGLEPITPAQSNALLVLFEAKRAMSARELAQALGVSDAAVARMVRALVAQGWVAKRRDEADGRVHWLAPTPRSYEALPQFIRVANGVIDAAFDGVDDAAGRAVLDAARRIWSNLGGTDDGAPATAGRHGDGAQAGGDGDG